MSFFSNRSRPINVDLPSSTEPQVKKRKGGCAVASVSAATSGSKESSTSITLPIRNNPHASFSPSIQSRHSQSGDPGVPTSSKHALRQQPLQRLPPPSGWHHSKDSTLTCETARAPFAVVHRAEAAAGHHLP